MIFIDFPNSFHSSNSLVRQTCEKVNEKRVSGYEKKREKRTKN